MTGEELHRRRQELGLSQRQLAMLLGITAQTVSNWERGKTPIRYPAILDLALEAIAARLARDGLLPAPSRQVDNSNALSGPESVGGRATDDS